MFLTAPETKDRTLEEMEVVFEIPAWKKAPKGSDLEKLAEEIETGNLKVHHKFGTTSHREDTSV
jgi:hypothetical protein